MTADEEIRDHQTRCQPYVLQLRMFAHGGYERMPTAAEVAQATGSIIAEVGAGGRAASAAARYRQVQPGAGTFLQVRLDRLMTAAEEAVAAARDGNAAVLSRVLRRFEALTTAIWTVQRAVYEPAGRPSQPPGDDGPAAGGCSPLHTAVGRDHAGPVTHRPPAVAGT
ncbi:MAG: hypothetical protein ACRDOL_14570 [Streptosporangiaceae bacterium]